MVGVYCGICDLMPALEKQTQAKPFKSLSLAQVTNDKDICQIFI